MQSYRGRQQMLLLCLAGFLAGIFYANFIAKNYVTMTGIFHEYFLNQYTASGIIARDYLIYLLRWRALPFAVLALAGHTRLRKVAAVAALLWTGFSGGILLVAAIMRMGIRGILLCLAGLFPQILFFAAAFAVLCWYLFSAPRTEWNRGKTVFVTVMVTAGIFAEAFLNPEIVQWMMDILA